MSATATRPQTSYLLRKLHSLSGIVPLGAFLAEHFWSNSSALVSAPKYNETSQELQTIPFRVLAEWAFIFLPILFLTARDSVRDRVKGLELGADDYLVKPFAFSELLARVRSVLRRAPQRQTEHVRIADLDMDMRRHKATRSGVPLNLTPKEFLLLAHLVRSAGEMVSRAEIAEQVWDIGFKTDTNVVDVVVRRLRAKVDDPFKTKLIHTIRGVGYVLKAG